MFTQGKGVYCKDAEGPRVTRRHVRNQALGDRCVGRRPFWDGRLEGCRPLQAPLLFPCQLCALSPHVGHQEPQLPGASAFRVLWRRERLCSPEILSGKTAVKHLPWPGVGRCPPGPIGAGQGGSSLSGSRSCGAHSRRRILSRKLKASPIPLPVLTVVCAVEDFQASAVHHVPTQPPRQVPALSLAPRGAAWQVAVHRPLLNRSLFTKKGQLSALLAQGTAIRQLGCRHREGSDDRGTAAWPQATGSSCSCSELPPGVTGEGAASCWRRSLTLAFNC